MGLGDWLRGKDTAPVIRRPDEMITAYDERGRELKIKRSAWALSVLAPAVEKAWDDPHALSAQIVQALHDDFVEQVAAAAERLLDLDKESERALVLAAIVRMECGSLDGAEAALSTSLAKHGPSATVLTNLAKIQDRRGDGAKARTTLREALDLDPNYENSLLWWATLAKEERGEAGFAAALEEIADLPGSWRPQVWLARERLKQGDRSSALALYRYVLSLAADVHDVLMMVTGDLGKAGTLDALVELGLPIYKPEVHGPHAGMNLVQALKQVGRIDEARDLVRRLQAMPWPPYAAALAALEAAIVTAAMPAKGDAPPAVGVYTFDRPTWTRGLLEPEWLFRARRDDDPSIFLFTFANALLASRTPQVQAADGLGRLTRSLPLYLAESLGLGFRVRSAACMLVSRGRGPAVFSQPISMAALAHQLPAGNGRRVLVGGTLVEDGLRLEIWEPSDPAPTTLDVPAPLDDIGALVTNAERALTAALSHRGLLTAAPPPGCFRAAPAELRAGYALALEQLFFQLLAANGVVPSSSLWNERGFYETYFNLVEAWANPPESARLIAICGTIAGATYRSTLVEPYRKIVLRWLDESPTTSVLARLAPAIRKRLGDVEGLRRWLDQAPTLGDADYMAWVERVRSDGSSSA